MKKPKPIVVCPFCNHKGEMTLYIRKLDLENFNDFNYWVYICQDCDERFTTTESDTISFNNMKRQVREKKLKRIINENIINI